MSHAYGRYHVPEPLHHLSMMTHRWTGARLKPVMHDIPLAVLEQENFAAQGIDTSRLVHGAPKVDALGNCVLNAATEAVSCLGVTTYRRYLDKLGLSTISVDLMADSKLGEMAAILAYHGCTDQTADPAQEWPPTDCGSSGVFMVQYLKKLGIISDQRVAQGAQNLVSLLQSGVVAEGTPFFNMWEEPNRLGFVDGDGSQSALEDAISSGVAGGHETLIRGIDKLSLTETDAVEPQKTVLRVRNSWGKSWNDGGEFYIHLSTLEMLSNYCDFRALIA